MQGVRLKNLAFLICIISVLVNCGPKPGMSASFSLEEEFSIDMEKEEMSDIGIIDIWGFDICSEGNFYIFGPPSRSENHIFKFDEHGRFIKAFGPKGQGPGEIQYPVYLRINSKDEIPIYDVYGSKLLRFSKDGELIDEIRLDQQLGRPGVVYPLENGTYLIVRVEPDVSGEFGFQILSIYDSNFNEIKEIDRFRSYYPQQAKRYKLPPDIFWWTLSAKGNIYVGNTERGYEISVYNLDGSLIRKIRKEYNPVPVPDELKEKAIGPIPEDHPLRKTLYFADHMPPFEFFFLDDKERLFVMTAELEEDQAIYDIFNAEGTFIGSKALNVSVNRFNKYGHQVFIRDEHLICIQEKQGGFKELVIYKMKWE